MSCWLWSIPPHNYPTCVEEKTFAIRTAGLNAIRQIKPGDQIYAYVPVQKAIAGVFRASGSYFHSTSPIWPDGIFPHRLRVEPEVLLEEAARIPLDAFKSRLTVGEDYPNFGLVIQKVIYHLPEVDCRVLGELVKAAVAPNAGLRVPEPVEEQPPPRIPRVGEPFPEQEAGEKPSAPTRSVFDDYVVLARSADGRGFEEATRKLFASLGFDLDTEYTGQSGEIDFVAVSPFRIYGECQTSGSSAVGVGIVDKLLRHRRRYQEAKQVPSSSEDVSLVVCEDTTQQLIQDSIGQGVAIARPSQLAALARLRSEYPGSSHPYKIGDIFREAGDVSQAVTDFLEREQTEAGKRTGVIEVLKNDRFANPGEPRGRSAGWIQAGLESELEVSLEMPEIEAILKELESPLVGCVASARDSQRTVFFYVQDFEKSRGAVS